MSRQTARNRRNESGRSSRKTVAPRHANGSGRAKTAPEPVKLSTARDSRGKSIAIVVIVAVLALGAGAYWFSPHAAALRHLARGRADEKAGRSDLAGQEFDAAVAADGRNADAWQALADHDYRTSEWEEAKDAYAEVLKFRPNAPHADSRMAVCAMNMKDYVNAYQFARKALAIDPNDIDALKIEIPISGMNGFALEDIDNIRRLAKLEPDNAQTLSLFANALLSKGMYDEARPVIDNLLTLEPNDMYGRFESALETVMTPSTDARLRQAIADLKDTNARYPSFAPAYQYLGKAYMRQSRWKDAVAALERAAALRPSRKEIQLDLIAACERAGEPSEAAAARARFDALQKQADEALVLEKQLDVNPNDFENNLKLGQIRIAEGEYRAAHLYIGRAAEINPNDPRVAGAVRTLERKQEDQP